MDAALATLDRTLRRARTRLRFRRILRGAAIGLEGGLVAAIPLAALCRVVGSGRGEAALVASLGVAGAVGLAALVGRLRRDLDPRAIALLVDRLGATDELVLTALHVRAAHADAPDPNREAILARLAASPIPDPRHLLPLSLPRHLRFAPIPALALLAVLAFVPPLFSLPWRAAPSPVAREGQRLAERVARNGGVLLPEPLEQQVEDLGEAMQGTELSPEEARRRIEELQRQLASFADGLETSRDLLHDLETAARALDASSPAERARTAEALEQAGRALQTSSDPELVRVGSGLERAANEGASPQGSDARARDLDAAEGLGDRLSRDAEALERSREIDAALEGARQRLGGSPGIAQGTGEDGAPSSGAGEGPGAPGAGEGASSVGSEGHTWEERSATGQPDALADDVRQSARTGGAQVDDFQRLYEGLRLDDATARLVRIEGAIDRDGQVEQLPVRITGDAADATAPTVTLPARYRAEAAEATSAETIPPAYAEAVKQYFDAMD